MLCNHNSLYFRNIECWNLKLSSNYCICICCSIHAVVSSSLYTMFLLENLGNPSTFLVKNWILSGFPTLDAATYSWPWQNHSFSNQRETFFKVWSWLLWIVNENASFTGNCTLCQAKPYDVSSAGSNRTFGIRTIPPFLCPLAILHFINLH